MSGADIADQQVCLYLFKREHHAHEIAAAKAGLSIRSVRRIERDASLLPRKQRGDWRSRHQPPKHQISQSASTRGSPRVAINAIPDGHGGTTWVERVASRHFDVLTMFTAIRSAQGLKRRIESMGKRFGRASATLFRGGWLTL